MSDLAIFDATVRLTMTIEVTLDVRYGEATTIGELHRDASERAVEGVASVIGTSRGLKGRVIGEPSIHVVSAPVV